MSDPVSDPVAREALDHVMRHLIGAPSVVAPEGAGADWWHAEVIKAVNARDMLRMDGLTVNAVMAGLDQAVVTTWFVEAVRAADHDTQVWWTGTCNCDGHLN